MLQLYTWVWKLRFAKDNQSFLLFPLGCSQWIFSMAVVYYLTLLQLFLFSFRSQSLIQRLFIQLQVILNKHGSLWSEFRRKAGLNLMPVLSCKIWCIVASIRFPSSSVLSISSSSSHAWSDQDAMHTLQIIKVNSRVIIHDFFFFFLMKLIAVHQVTSNYSSSRFQFSQIPLARFHLIPEASIFIHFLQHSSIFAW